MSKRQVVREVTVHLCDGCNRETGQETLYVYDTGVELCIKCYEGIRSFEYYKFRKAWAVREIKDQLFY